MYMYIEWSACYRYDTSLADECSQLADRWSVTTSDEDEGRFTPEDLDNMSSNQLQVFLNQLQSKVRVY